MPLLYRGHAAFLFTSRYEAWGLPVMEAMASGLPVVATRCLGLAAFAEHGFNCLLADAQAGLCPCHVASPGTPHSRTHAGAPFRPMTIGLFSALNSRHPDAMCFLPFDLGWPSFATRQQV